MTPDPAEQKEWAEGLLRERREMWPAYPPHADDQIALGTALHAVISLAGEVERLTEALRKIGEARESDCDGVALCQSCGEEHVWQPNPLFDPDSRPAQVSGSWASPKDGHALHRTGAATYARSVLAAALSPLPLERKGL